jgi:Tfp pilus assembly protein PilZ
MAKQWFLYSSDLVSGPHSTADIQQKLISRELLAESYIWWKGQREWVPAVTWRNDLESIIASHNTSPEHPVWYIDMGEKPIGPLTHLELIENLSRTNNPSQIRLWAVGMKKWKSLFEVQDVLERLGISRREHERAPIMGTLTITRTNDSPLCFSAKMASISVGGAGVSDVFDLRNGDDVLMVLKSREIPSLLHISGEVVYAAKNGNAGIKFRHVSEETWSLIHSYVKKFYEHEKQSKKSAA